MIWALLLGIILGVSKVSNSVAFIVIPGLIIPRALSDICFRKRFITGGESNYVLYVKELEKTHQALAHPWITYLLQSTVFFIPSGLIVFFIAKYVMVRIAP